MSVDAKRSLYAKERGLDFDGQKRVASLLARRLGEPALACGGTVEVDVDAIGDATLWEIRAIVDQLDGTDKADEKGVEEGVVRAAGRDVEEVERALVRLMYVVNDGVPSRREGRATAKKQYRKTGQH